MYLVNKIQLRLNLYFELFDLENMYEFDDVLEGAMKLCGDPPPAYTTDVVFAESFNCLISLRFKFLGFIFSMVEKKTEHALKLGFSFTVWLVKTIGLSVYVNCSMVRLALEICEEEFIVQLDQLS